MNTVFCRARPVTGKTARGRRISSAEYVESVIRGAARERRETSENARLDGTFRAL